MLVLQALLNDIMAMTRADSGAASSDSSLTQQHDWPCDDAKTLGKQAESVSAGSFPEVAEKLPTTQQGPQHGPQQRPQQGLQQGPQQEPQHGPQWGPQHGPQREPQHGPQQGPQQGLASAQQQEAQVLQAEAVSGERY